MSIADFTALKTLRANGLRLLRAQGLGQASATNGHFTDPLRNLHPNVAAWVAPIPSTPVTFSSSDLGCFFYNGGSGGLQDYRNAEAGKHWVLGGLSSRFPYTDGSAMFWLVDRLCHQGGLSYNDATPQTLNLPTAALPRFTDGLGVQIGLANWVAGSINPTDVTVSYTNSDGVVGRVTPANTCDTVSNSLRFQWLPLQQGDKGVLSVQSVTLSVAGTGSSGNFGVFLFKPLAMLSFSSPSRPTVFRSDLGSWVMPTIANDCGLQIFASNQGSNLITEIELLLLEVPD